MTTVEEIKKAVSELSQDDLATFRKWFWGFDAERWDEQLEEDIEAGKLDKLIEEVRADLRAGRIRPIAFDDEGRIVPG
ncbi:MAG: hypothetical protein WAM60_20440 [Candidatus Promineifilaceae bacterium]